jgi:hypothetical protein
MPPEGRVALALTVHTGWAAAVVAGGTLRAPRVEAREQVELLGDPDRFVYHRAAKTSRPEAERSLAVARKAATARAVEALGRIVGRARKAGLDVVGCAIIANDAPMLASLDEILVAHPRIHTAEGCFFRDVLRAGAEAQALPTRVLPARGLQAAAALVMHVESLLIPGLLDDAASTVGRPWGKDQKLASLGAWVVLGAK